MNGQRCFLMGHRDAPEAVFPAVLEAVEQHIVQHGVTEFLVGRRGAFDCMAARAVKQAKKTHPGVILTLLLPYHPGEKPTKLPDGFDGSLYPVEQETVPKRLAILRANRYAVEHSGYLIAYAWQPGSNTRKMTTWALGRAQKGLGRVTLVETGCSGGNGVCHGLLPKNK